MLDSSILKYLFALNISLIVIVSELTPPIFNTYVYDGELWLFIVLSISDLLIVGVVLGYVTFAVDIFVSVFCVFLTVFTWFIQPSIFLFDLVIIFIISFPTVSLVIFFIVNITWCVASSNLLSTVAPPAKPSHS